MKSKNETKRFFVYKNSELIRIDPMNILYMSASGSYCNIHLDGVVLKMANNLSHIFSIVEEEEYLIRLDRSIVVNVEKINRIIGCILIMSNGENVVLGELAMKKVKDMVTIIK